MSLPYEARQALCQRREVPSCLALLLSRPRPALAAVELSDVGGRPPVRRIAQILD